MKRAEIGLESARGNFRKMSPNSLLNMGYRNSVRRCLTDLVAFGPIMMGWFTSRVPKMAGKRGTDSPTDTQ